MSGSRFGEIFSVTTFGESHGEAVGCVIDGCPAGVRADFDLLRKDLARRRPGAGAAATSRAEPDEPEVLSGVFEGLTTGTAIAVLIRSTQKRSADYDSLKDVFRPGHADVTYLAKYGFRDHRGGGRASGRETAGRVAAGAFAKMLLAQSGISFSGWVSEIAGIKAPNPGEAGFDAEQIEKNSLCMPCAASVALALEKIDTLRKEGDSAGGIVNCVISSVPAGLGEPVFNKLDAMLAHAMLSIGAVKGFEIGTGFGAALLKGSQNNDGLVSGGFASNNSGGVLGGISTGQDIEFRVAFKPVPSISKKQQTMGTDGAEHEIEIGGRHDICICPRAVPVVEAMAAIVIADLLLQNRASRANWKDG
jgi:chorismate synthase